MVMFQTNLDCALFDCRLEHRLPWDTTLIFLSPSRHCPDSTAIVLRVFSQSLHVLPISHRSSCDPQNLNPPTAQNWWAAVHLNTTYVFITIHTYTLTYVCTYGLTYIHTYVRCTYTHYHILWIYSDFVSFPPYILLKLNTFWAQGIRNCSLFISVLR